MTALEKAEFRKTKKWKDFRKRIAEKYNNRDAITGEKLRKGWNLHHMDLNKDNYIDLTDETHFIPLNKGSHKKLHEMFVFSKKPERMLKLLLTIEEMREINER